MRRLETRRKPPPRSSPLVGISVATCTRAGGSSPSQLRHRFKTFRDHSVFFKTITTRRDRESDPRALEEGRGCWREDRHEVEQGPVGDTRRMLRSRHVQESWWRHDKPPPLSLLRFAMDKGVGGLSSSPIHTLRLIQDNRCAPPRRDGSGAVACAISQVVTGLCNPTLPTSSPTIFVLTSGSPIPHDPLQIVTKMLQPLTIIYNPSVDEASSTKPNPTSRLSRQ